jgi:hypothetical protein
MPQFIVAGSGDGAAGKNKNRNATLRKHMAMRLTTIPMVRGIVKREAGNGSLRNLRARTVPMTTRYEVKRPVAETDRIMLNAVVEPMMISARMQVYASVT